MSREGIIKKQRMFYKTHQPVLLLGVGRLHCASALLRAFCRNEKKNFLIRILGVKTVYKH